MVVVLGDRRRRKGIGLGNIGAGGEILVVQVGDDVRARDAQDIVIALELTAMVREARTPEIGLVEPAPLDHNAPGAIQDQNAFFRSLLQSRYAFGTGHCAVSFTPRMRQIA